MAILSLVSQRALWLRRRRISSTLLLLLFASKKFCDFEILSILRVLIFAISSNRAKFAISRHQR